MEFNFKFKVGDKIHRTILDDDYSCEILCIGEKKFFYRNSNGDEYTSTLDDSYWELSDPKKEEPAALWQWVYKRDCVDEIEIDYMFNSEKQAGIRYHLYSFYQKIGKPWYFIDGELVQKDEMEPKQ